MKRTNALLAVAVAAVLIGAGIWVMLPGKGEDLPPNDDDGPDVPDVPGNLTDPIAKVPHAVEIDEKDVKLRLQLDYPGKGTGTEYAWNEAYEFVLSTSGSGWDGRAVIKVFAERAESIGAKCLIMTYGDGIRATWDDHVVHGAIHLSADAVVWISNGTDDRTDRFSVLFNRTGTFGLTFQAFDADTGDPLSAPVSTGQMVVPEAGSMDIRALSGVEEVIENDTFYVVIINATNGWNVRHSMDAAYLVLSSDKGEALVDVDRTTFTAQLLEPGQSTQFLAYFPMEDIGGDLELIYAEPGQPPVTVSLE
jgi:hypothetical protein